MMWRQKFASRRSPTTKSSHGKSVYSWNLRSTPRTQNPSDLSRFAKCPPIKPPAPHTTAVFMDDSRPNAGIADLGFGQQVQPATREFDFPLIAPRADLDPLLALAGRGWHREGQRDG